MARRKKQPLTTDRAPFLGARALWGDAAAMVRSQSGPSGPDAKPKTKPSKAKKRKQKQVASGGRKVMKTQKELDAYFKRLKGQKDRVIAIGWEESNIHPSGVPTAQIALRNEYGQPEYNVPQRRFMWRTWRNSARSKTFQNIAKSALNYHQGQWSTHLAEGVGDWVVNQIRGTIDRWVTPPNRPYTVKKKGFNDPLVETGHMRDTVDWWEVRG